MYEDALYIAKLIQKNYGDFYIIGFSIGSVVASYVASRHKTLGLFLIGSFDSIKSVAKYKFKVDISFLFKYKFDTASFVKDVTAKTYLFATKADEITYIQTARELKKSIKNLVYYVEYDDLTHHQLLFDKRVVSYIDGVVNGK